MPKSARITLFKKLLLTGVLTLFGLELAVRVAFAFKIGPRTFLYGLVSDRDELNVQNHENVVVGHYSKYFPHEHRRDTDPDAGETFDVRINSEGFRGADFSVAKPAGVIRIVTLGASSTFGYHDRDDETYPHYLEKLLDDGCPKHKFEVINLGIPHLDAEQILSLFLNEAVPLDPDFVTFYEGVNDSEGGGWRAPVKPSLWARVRLAVHEHSLLASILADRLKKSTFSASDVEHSIAGKSAHFLASLERLREEAGKRHIGFLVVTQQVKSGIVERDKIAGVTYAEEVRLVEQHLSQAGTVEPNQLCLLTHDTLMRDLRRWAGEKGVPLVDGIAALDHDRDVLVSWVHLTPKGNRILAGAIANGILPLACADGH